MRRALLVALAAAAFLAPGASAGRTECDGLLVCVRLVGPWVQVPAGTEPTYYRISCPQRAPTIGGLDADLGSGGVDVTFLGNLGGPIGAGTTTGRDAVFVARATRGRTATFRPRLGCIPGAGGGGRSRTAYHPTRKLAAVAPPAATLPAAVWRSQVVRVARSGQSVRVSCKAKERLLSFGSAIAFRQARAPTAAQLASVRAVARPAGLRRAAATATGRPPTGVRVQLQVQAVCGS